MEATKILLALILPSIIWIVLCYWWDRKEPEPKLLITKLLFSGMLLGIFIAISLATLQTALVSTGLFLPFNALSEKDSLASFFIASAIVATTHAVVTFWIAKILITREKSFTQIVDGIIYFSVIAVGAAFTENIISSVIYVSSNNNQLQSVNALIYSLVYNTILLGVCAGIIGFAFGNVYKRASQDRIIEDVELTASLKNPEIVEGLSVAILLHTAYQVFVYLKEPRVAGFIAIVAMLYIFTRFASRSFTSRFQE